MKPDTAKFRKDVYDIVKQIPSGKVSTYGQVAVLAGYPNHSRMVGAALAHTPEDDCVPAFRVVNSQGRLVPGWDEQKELLEKEGITFRPNGEVNMKKHGWDILE